jgi:hypothetical protein
VVGGGGVEYEKFDKSIKDEENGHETKNWMTIATNVN